MAKVSVIVPVYNMEKYLNKCISSVANQTLEDIEIIAINDGSCDNSLSILDDLSRKYKNLIVINQENKGVGNARNKGLDIARGEFVKFVDADDYLDLTILDKMYKLAKDNNVKLVRGNYKMILGSVGFNNRANLSLNTNGIVDVEDNKDYLFNESPSIGNKLISRDLIGDLKFKENSKWEDLSFIPVVVASSKKLLHLNDNVYNYRMAFNTTLKDFIFKIPNVLDIIFCLDKMKLEMANKGLDDEYQIQIEKIYILHTLYRIQNIISWLNVSKEEKIEFINYIVDLLNVKYPNWYYNEVTRNFEKKHFICRKYLSKIKLGPIKIKSLTCTATCMIRYQFLFVKLIRQHSFPICTHIFFRCNREFSQRLQSRKIMIRQT